LFPTTKAVETWTDLERRIEGDEPGAVDHGVHLPGERLEASLGEAEQGIGDVAVQHLAAGPDERFGLLVSVVVAERLERLAADDLLQEPGLGAARRPAADEGPDPPQHRSVAVEEHGEGDLAQKSGAAGQEDALAGEGVGHREHRRFHGFQTG
jgi:hypothetical protein